MIGQFLVNTVLSLTDTEQCVKSVKLTLENCFIHQFSDSIGWVPKYDSPPPKLYLYQQDWSLDKALKVSLTEDNSQILWGPKI